MFAEPGDDFAVGRIDEAMAEPQSVINTERCALDVEARTGAQFAREAGVDPARQVVSARQCAEAEFVGEIGFGLFQPIEVVGDGEVLGHVALPGRHTAAVGLGPVRHAAISAQIAPV